MQTTIHLNENFQIRQAVWVPQYRAPAPNEYHLTLGDHAGEVVVTGGYPDLLGLAADILSACPEEVKIEDSLLYSLLASLIDHTAGYDHIIEMVERIRGAISEAAKAY